MCTANCIAYVIYGVYDSFFDTLLASLSIFFFFAFQLNFPPLACAFRFNWRISFRMHNDCSLSVRFVNSIRNCSVLPRWGFLYKVIFCICHTDQHFDLNITLILCACVNHRKFIKFFSCVSIFFSWNSLFSLCYFLSRSHVKVEFFFLSSHGIDQHIYKSAQSFFYFFHCFLFFLLFFIYSSSLRLFGTFFSCVLQFAYFFFQHLN